MPESIPIPLDLLAETRAALDAALSCVGSTHPACTQIEKARRKLNNLCGDGQQSCDKLSGEKRQEGYQLLRHLDEVKRKIKKDYGLEK